MIPKRSLHGILQEDLWPNDWAILVTCLLLNRTTRKQVERVLGQFFTSWPTPEELLRADKEHVSSAIASLGFKHRRAELIFKMSETYVTKNWKDASELPGIGAYGAACWRMLFRQEFSDVPPEDHALVDYWRSCRETR